MKKHALAIALMSFAGISHAALLASDDFSYANGNLVPNGGWSNHSGSGSFIQVDNGEASLAHGSGSREDAGLNFTETTTGTIFASFDLRVTDDSVISGSDFEYFAHFMEDGTFNFNSRLDVVAPNASGDFSLGIATRSSTAETVYGTDLLFGVDYAVVLSFDFTTGLTSLTVDGGSTISSTTIQLGETIDRFALRQSNSSNDESIFIDNLVITDDTVPAIPVPAAVWLFGSGLLGLVAVARRQV